MTPSQAEPDRQDERPRELQHEPGASTPSATGPPGSAPAAPPPTLRVDPDADPLARVLDLVRILREHCPWDAAQTPQTLVPYLLEEAHEAADAIMADDDAELRSELGDLLLNLAFQIVLAEERAAFRAGDVADAVVAKMVRRHPDIFTGASASGVDANATPAPDPAEGQGPAGGEGEGSGAGRDERPGSRSTWEALKAAERDEAASTLSGIPSSLDPLSRAHRIQDRVAGVGFDWADARGAFEKVAEELEEVRQALEAEPSPALEEELGDLLFAVVNLSRLAGSHSLNALHRANAKFTRRFQALESLAGERGVVLGEATLEELDALWDEVKRRER